MPIWVAASGPLAAAMAGQIAEGFICTSGKNPQLYTDLTAKVERGPCQRRGRSEDSLERMIEVKVSFDTDQPAGDGGHAALGGAGPDAGGEDQCRGPDRNGEASPRPCRSSARPAAGSSQPIPKSRSTQIRPYVELGFTHLVFHAPGPDQARFLKLYAEQVLPLLRAKFG